MGFAFFYCGAILSWHSKLNTVVTTSTNHSEYSAMALATKEAEWQRLLFETFEGSRIEGATPIFVDNAGVVALANNPVDHAANKHISVICSYVRERVASGIVVPLRIASEDNLADIFTKPLGATLFDKCSRSLVAASASHVVLMITDGIVGPEVDPPSFFDDWPYVTRVMQELHADGFIALENGQTFPQKGNKFDIIFFVNRGPEKLKIATRLGMKKTSKTGAVYYICRREPAPCMCQACGTRMVCMRCEKKSA